MRGRVAQNADLFIKRHMSRAQLGMTSVLRYFAY